ncbi:methyltransferase domain-containing protein [Colletotrichum musicola]|uniref:Methyltransferase domain-containing protein n=1 Tax=Colletotrichum musicola TaxID=2175873 RepID=A0A8H6KDT0_9PEZI|nr:methyltransferase domain-containing protein [Colletotrichum musicola]
MSNNNTTGNTTAAAAPVLPAAGTNPSAAESPAQAAVETDHDNNDDDFLAAEEDTDDGESVRQESVYSSSTSVNSSILEYREENGRTYHKYKDGSKYRSTPSSVCPRPNAPTRIVHVLTTKAEYNAPNDERELDRLELQHNLIMRTFDGRLGTAPPNDPGAKVGRVLDVGTGTGIWAIEFGDEHPEADVLGVDLSAVQSKFVPPNVRFEIDDIEEPWERPQPFDYIHSRIMTGSIRDWRRYLENCFENLSPGGYLELNDVDVVPVSDDGTLTEETSLLQSVRLWCEALENLGSPFEEFSRLKDVLIDIGFEDVHIQRFKWPTNSWPKDPKYKELGMWNYENLAPNWEGLLMAGLTRGLDWSKEEVLILAMNARKDFGNRSIHGYFNFWSIYGRKPLEKAE